MKLLTFLIIFISFLIYAFFNLGRFLDVTEEPTKTDLIVSLGGNGYTRLQKSISLVEKEFSNIIIITGYEGTPITKAKNIPDPRLNLIVNKKYENIKFIINPNLKNTAEEIIYVKRYMKENNLTNVTFVTEKPHSRRISILVNILEKGFDKDFVYKIVSNDMIYWNSKEYYKNKDAKEYALNEVVKIIFNITYYGIFYNLGINNFFEKDIEEMKPIILRSIKDFVYLDIF